MKKYFVVVFVIFSLCISSCGKNDNIESSFKETKNNVEENGSGNTLENKNSDGKNTDDSVEDFVDYSKVKVDIPDEYDKLIDANISKYYTYGTHFNLEGSVKLKDVLKKEKSEENQDNKESQTKGNYKSRDITNIDFIGVSYDAKDYEESFSIPVSYSIKNKKIKVKLSKKINEGLDLETLNEGAYVIYLKVSFNDGNVKYVSICNKAKEEDIEYYTITDVEKNNIGNGRQTDNNLEEQTATSNYSNRRIDILSDNDKKYMYIKCYGSDLPEDVYDFAIDAGHGGDDVGAISFDKMHYEKDETLDVALLVQKKLTDMGYKTIITRDGTEKDDEYGYFSSYDDNGRVTIVARSKAKLALSIHLNSTESYTPTGGVQIYCSTRANNEMAQSIADSLVNNLNTEYSPQETYKVSDGVYKHNFLYGDMQTLYSDAYTYNFKAYDVTEKDDFLYMIREVGGIATRAYVDGRNKYLSPNKYIDSNTCVESCLCEIAYMSIPGEFYYFLGHKEEYADALIEGMIEYCMERDSY